MIPPVGHLPLPDTHWLDAAEGRFSFGPERQRPYSLSCGRLELSVQEGSVQRGIIARIASGVSVCLLTLSLSGTDATAFDLGEWIPGLKLSPFLSERVEYESNIFQTPSHTKDDIIFKTIPGFVADYSFGPHSISAGYRAEILRYLDLTNQDTVHHIAVGQLRLDFPRTLLTLGD